MNIPPAIREVYCSGDSEHLCSNIVRFEYYSHLHHHDRFLCSSLQALQINSGLVTYKVGHGFLFLFFARLAFHDILACHMIL